MFNISPVDVAVAATAVAVATAVATAVAAATTAVAVAAAAATAVAATVDVAAVAAATAVAATAATAVVATAAATAVAATAVAAAAALGLSDRQSLKIQFKVSCLAVEVVGSSYSSPSSIQKMLCSERVVDHHSLFKFPIPGVFFDIFVFFLRQLTLSNCSIYKLADDWIRIYLWTSSGVRRDCSTIYLSHNNPQFDLIVNRDF